MGFTPDQYVAIFLATFSVNIAVSSKHVCSVKKVIKTELLTT